MTGVRRATRGRALPRLVALGVLVACAAPRARRLLPRPVLLALALLLVPVVRLVLLPHLQLPPFTPVY